MSIPSHRPPMRPGPLAQACAWALLAMTATHGVARDEPDQTIVITGNPLGRATGAQPLTTLSGAALVQRRAGTLGETLDGLPGVSATRFGPNASRPVLRGLDGDRVRLLDNGGASVDASALSFDHASATDPLLAERIEIHRGPAALLYGGSAIGGVINVVDNRIPRAPAAGVSGRAELRAGGASSERAGAALLEGGAGAWAWHADAYTRDADDQRAPLHVPLADGEALEPTRRVRNSAASAEGGALGFSRVDGAGHVGLALDTSRQGYGVTVEPEVTIRMRRDRASFGLERRLGGAGPIAAFSIDASHSRYEHRELEGGEVGTTFRSEGDELRAQARHAAVPLAGGRLAGVFGLQLRRVDFSALGEEAFVPGTHTRSDALFALGEWEAPLLPGGLVASLGLRAERVRVASDGDAPEADEPRFGPGSSRRFAPRSLALALRSAAASGWVWNLALSGNERAPSDFELYANGVHVATAAYERGDPALGVERSRHLEAGLGWLGPAASLRATLFQTRFPNYIALDATGAEVLVTGEDGTEQAFPEYLFRAVPARLRGFELEARSRLLQGPVTLELSGTLDAVRGDDRARGQPLPRLAPRRATLALEAGWRGHRAVLRLTDVARQDRVPDTDTPTPGWSRVDLSLAGPLGARASWFARAGNLGNRLAYNAGTIATLRALTPLPGRSFSAGLRLAFE